MSTDPEHLITTRYLSPKLADPFCIHDAVDFVSVALEHALTTLAEAGGNPSLMFGDIKMIRVPDMECEGNQVLLQLYVPKP